VRDPILAGLKGVVNDGEGTAHGAFAGFPLNRMSVAGKTGTAQVAKKQDTALFVAFAPADNPQYVVAVVMEESGFGGSVAAPVARRILEKLAGGADTGATVVGGTD
jgi:penicillin-binding protein 2